MKLLSLIALSLSLLFSCGQSKAKKQEKEPINEVVTTLPQQVKDTLLTFENEKTGTLPPAFSQSFTGKGELTDWKIVDDNGNKVIAQLSNEQPNYHFNNLIINDFDAKNMVLETKMKGVAGRKDQGGGFIWRYTDKNNYYVVRANPLEDNVVLYKVEKGKRTDLAVMGQGRTYGVEVDPIGNDWVNLKLEVVNDLFTVYLNGTQLFQVKDVTFSHSGKVGFWTKADAVTYFDEFKFSILE